jgi:hypothetical protein
MKNLISKQQLATLIDAYAAAKATDNDHLVDTMTVQLRSAIDNLYSAIEASLEVNQQALPTE